MFSDVSPHWRARERAIYSGRMQIKGARVPWVAGTGRGFRLSGGVHGRGVSAIMLAGFGEQLW